MLDVAMGLKETVLVEYDGITAECQTEQDGSESIALATEAY